MKFRATLLFAVALAGVAAVVAPARIAAAETAGQITILYDAFGADAAMKKDWGFSALVEISGKRILFDTGNDADIFAANVKAKNIDLTSIDFVVLSHRHSDHMAGLNHVLSVNPTVKITHPRRDSAFSARRCRRASTGRTNPCRRRCDIRRQAAGDHEIRHRVAARQHRAHRQDNGNRPGITLIALVSDAPGTKELKELSLAVNTADGVVLVVGCAHPGIEKIVEAATTINPKIH